MMNIKTYKVIIVGDCNVGKTCLSFRLCEGKFPSEVSSTIGLDFRERIFNINGEAIKLQIWDTAGQERFRSSMVPHYYRNVDAVIFVYDMTNMLSFKNLHLWIEECDQYAANPIVKILVGNKCDSTNPPSVVQTHKAQCFADRCNMPLFETSAICDSESDHLTSIFFTVAYKLKAERPMMIAENISSIEDIVLPNLNEKSVASYYCC